MVHEFAGPVVAVAIATTLLYQVEGMKDEALRMLEVALSAAAPTGLFRIFLDECEPLQALLAELKPWLREQWCIPPQANAAFVCQMEDVLDVYKLPYDANRPVICMDEMPKQLLAQTREPIACQAGKPAREDYEYKRNGVADLFLVFELLQGKRFVEVTEKRRKLEWATVMKNVADTLYPQAEKIVVVLDNLNIHTPSAFYETFAPEEARRLVKRFEFHFTHKHGSWLNMAEIELSALVRQCPNRRLPDTQTLTQEIQAWQQLCNDEVVKAHWQFQTTDARTKLKHLYPKIRV